MKRKVKELFSIELIIVTTLIVTTINLLKFFDLLNFLNLLIIFSFFVFLVSKLNNKLIFDYFRLSLLTIFFMIWSAVSTGIEYLVYEFDWNSFGIPINLNINSNLYSNDILANQEFPHYWIYKLVSLFLNTSFFNQLFLVGFILQNLLLVKSINLIYIKFQKFDVQNNYYLIILTLPLFFYPQISGHYVSLPYFLPAILGYSLAIYCLVSFIFKKEIYFEDYIFLLLLIFAHPYWSAFVSLYLFFCFFFTKSIPFINSAPFLVIFTLSLFLNDFGGISISEIYKTELVQFYKTYIKIHFDWSAHIGSIFQNNLNNYYQQSLLIIFTVLLIWKKSYINFENIENTFYSSFGLISLIIILGNFFNESSFNNFLVASNFYRLGSLSWIFLSVFCIEIFKNKFSSAILFTIPLVFYILSGNEIFSKSTNFLPTIIFSSNYIYLFLVISILFFYKNRNNHSMFFIILGLIYFLTFYFIDKIMIENYLIKSSILSILVIIFYGFLQTKISFNNNFIIGSILFLFVISTFNIDIVFQKIKLDYSTQISTENIQLIQEYTNTESVILVEPSLPYFRKETKRGQFLDFALIPYNMNNYSIYKSYKSLFNGKSLKNLTEDEIINIVYKTNVSELIIPIGSYSENYFLSKFNYIKLDNFGYLIFLDKK